MTRRVEAEIQRRFQQQVRRFDFIELIPMKRARISEFQTELVEF